MTAPGLPDRDRAVVEALVADRYLEALLAGMDPRAGDAPADAALQPELREAARILRRSLVRVHPSFRFEERLASRIRELAVAGARPATLAIPDGTVIAFPGVPVAAAADDPLLAAVLRGELDPADAAAIRSATRGPAPRRPLLVGGAITSAALSIVGVAWVAWRAAHPAEGAMVRAARTARSRRATGAAPLPAGSLGGPA